MSSRLNRGIPRGKIRPWDGRLPNIRVELGQVSCTNSVWPGLGERPDIAHAARDWLAKLHLVAAGCGITTVPAALGPAVPPGVRILPVRGGPAEQRRILLARLPHPLPERRPPRRGTSRRGHRDGHPGVGQRVRLF
jgi:hypothetical protein